jgi:hypothetical protein
VTLLTGIPAKLIRPTKLMTDNCAIFKLRNVVSRQFDIKKGLDKVIQKACLLLNFSLEKIIRDAEVETRGTVFNKSVQISAYADDIHRLSRN